MYHQVLRARSGGKFDTWVLESALRRQFEHLRRERVETVTFRGLERPAAPGRRRVILTFDDGYEDNYTTLFPLLQEFGFTAVIFMVTRLATNAWAAAQGEPEARLMTPAQARELAAHGVELGGHTRHHVNFDLVSPAVAREEIRGCKADLEDWLGVPAVSFAYPFGAIHAHAKRAVEEAGFRWGVATKSGPLHLADDRYEVRRLAISYRTGMLAYRLKTSGRYHQPLHGLVRVPGAGG
jgi:peptidoglycan/xylan/chitin deacetylase (PgdA/CDA1 family)